MPVLHRLAASGVTAVVPARVAGAVRDNQEGPMPRSGALCTWAATSRESASRARVAGCLCRRPPCARRKRRALLVVCSTNGVSPFDSERRTQRHIDPVSYPGFELPPSGVHCDRLLRCAERVRGADRVSRRSMENGWDANFGGRVRVSHNRPRRASRYRRGAGAESSS